METTIFPNSDIHRERTIDAETFLDEYVATRDDRHSDGNLAATERVQGISTAIKVFAVKAGYTFDTETGTMPDGFRRAVKRRLIAHDLRA